MRLAVIGCGFQGSLHAASIAACPEATLAVCCDEDFDRATTVAATNGAARWTDDWRAVLSSGDVDGVIIATPTHNHAELGLTAIHSGKHVLLEKPMATNVEDCQKIEQAAMDTGVVVMIGFKFRFAPAVVAAKDAVPEPAVLHAHTLYDTSQVTSGWVSDRSLSGGRLMSSLVHSIDLLRYLSGSEPVRVSAEGESIATADDSEPDTAVATIRFANGAIASLVHGTATASPLLSTWSFQTADERANATIFDHARRMSLRSNGTNSPVFVDNVENPFAAGMQPLMRAFVDAAIGGEMTSPGPRDGTISVRVSRLIERAISSGESQKVEVS